jgi:hypothetical protein
MKGKPLDANQEVGSASHDRQNPFSRLKHLIGGSSRLPRHQKSPYPRIGNAVGAKSAASTQSSSAPSAVKAVHNKDAHPGANITKSAQASSNPTRAIDFWAIAETELLKDPRKSEKLKQYNLVLKTQLGSELEPSGTPERRKQILDFLEKEVERLNSTESQTRLRNFKRKTSRFFNRAIRFVVGTHDIIKEATSHCLPASVACVGVVVLLSVSTLPE